MSQRDAEKQGDDDGREAQWPHVVNVGPIVSGHVCHFSDPMRY